MIVTGIANWAKVGKDNFDARFNKWTLDLTMDKTNAEILKGAGLKPKEVAKGEFLFKFKKDRLRKKDNTEKVPPIVRDAKNQNFDGYIGNGSLVRVQFTVIPYTKFGGGITHELQGVQVLKLVEYNPGGGSEFTPVEEYIEEDQTAAPDENPFV